MGETVPGFIANYWADFWRQGNRHSAGVLMPEPTKADMRRAMQETINEEVIGRIDAEERAEAAEAQTEEWRERCRRLCDPGEGNWREVLTEAREALSSLAEPGEECSWGASRKKLREALSSPADSQEQG